MAGSRVLSMNQTPNIILMTTYDFIEANKRKSVMLIVFFIVFVLGIGWLLDGYYGGGGIILVIATVYGVVMALVSYYGGDKVALFQSGAKEITSEDNPYVYRMVENLCISQGMQVPRVHIIHDPAINAFATGRDPAHASIAVTKGAIDRLENEELEAVLAHELSHIKNYDIRVMTIVIVLVGIVTLVGDIVFRSILFGRRRNRDGGGAVLIIGLVLMIFAPIIAKLIQLAVSRRREYLADASASLMTRFPEGLIRALEKIGRQHRPMIRASSATAHLFFANPFSGKAMASLFSSHPPLEKRIDALMRMTKPA